MELLPPTKGISKSLSSPKPPLSRPLPESTDSQSLRVIQKNLVYVTNIASSLGDVAKLTSFAYFGQYGRILKCTLHKSTVTSLFNAYLTFETEESAALCVKACNFFQLCGQTLEASLGTTRYCSYLFQHKQ